MFKWNLENKINKKKVYWMDFEVIHLFFNEKNVTKVIKARWSFWSSIVSNINFIA